MEYLKVKGIVISSVDLKEKDKLINIFSLEHGIISAVLKSVKSEKSKLKSVKEIFCFADFIISLPSRVVTSVEIIDSFHDVTNDLSKYFCACTIIEIVKTVLKQGEENQVLFVNTLKAIGTIAYDKVMPDYVVCKYLIQIFQAMGYQLSLNKCTVCGQYLINKRYLNLTFGEVVCQACKSGENIEISQKAFSAIKVLEGCEYEKIYTVKLAPGSEKDCLCILKQNFSKRFLKQLNFI